MNLGAALPYVVIAAVVAALLASRFMGKASAADARALVAEGALLLDVRSTGEFASGHIDGAVNIPVDQLARRIGDVGAKERPVVVYCRSGARSGQAAGILRGAGFARVEDLGAMHRW